VDEREWRRDGWDADTRIGLLTPAGDLGPEAEFMAMCPATVTVHASRVPFAAMRQRGAMDPTIALEAVRAMAQPPGVDAAVELLALAPLDVIGFAFTSSSYVIGRDGEIEMCARLGGRAGGLPIVASGAAMVDAAVSLGAQSVFVVSPPWFDAQLSELGSQYFASAGLDVVAAASADLPSDQRSIAPAPLHAWVMANAPVEADVVIIGGNGFRAVGVIEALELDLGRPVVTANQALLWSCVTQVGASAQVVGYGRLFD
jgi:maleate isomerase